jgi:hypothetical protein
MKIFSRSLLALAMLGSSLTPAFAVQPNAVTASRTITSSDAGTVITVSAAAGLTLTLPAATGTGYVYRVFISTTVTSNNVIVQVADATDVMQGNVTMAQDAGDTAVIWEAASTSDTITLNGSTKGGIRGDFFEFTDAAADLYIITGLCSGTGTEITLFSAAV